MGPALVLRARPATGDHERDRRALVAPPTRDPAPFADAESAEEGAQTVGQTQNAVLRRGGLWHARGGPALRLVAAWNAIGAESFCVAQSPARGGVPAGLARTVCAARLVLSSAER